VRGNGDAIREEIERIEEGKERLPRALLGEKN
jgi:hypothetical protein